MAACNGEHNRIVIAILPLRSLEPPRSASPLLPPSIPPVPLRASGVAMALFDYERVARAVKEWPTWVLRKAKVAAQYGFVPLVITVGMLYTEPQPHLLQLIGP
ncbi:unnamed protein product [Closterium sp. NIES-64]|nr:unnamed protein product [Closterium sp. NIES-64]